MAAGIGKEARATTKAAEELIEEYVVVRGMSYADAITKLERKGLEARAPYAEAAYVIREWAAPHVPNDVEVEDG